MSQNYLSIKLDRNNLSDARRLLLSNEYTAINLTEVIRLSIEKATYFEQGIKSAWLLYSNNSQNTVIGCIALTATGVLLHSFMEQFNFKIAEALLIKILPAQIHSILGLEQHTVHLVEVYQKKYNRKAHRLQTYFLLCRDKNKAVLTKHSYHCMQSREADIAKLLPLHIAYIKSEVLPPGKIIPIEWYQKNLRLLLQKQIIYHISDTNTIIGKAGTNAQGYNWNQIGGVYTLPAYRNKGICSALILTLAKTAQTENKSLALFVKQDNYAALTSYQNAGFEKKAFLTIASFN